MTLHHHSHEQQNRGGSPPITYHIVYSEKQENYKDIINEEDKVKEVVELSHVADEGIKYLILNIFCKYTHI